MEIRRVSGAGHVSWRGQPLYLTEALRGQDIGFEEVDDGIWMLYFATVRVARFDERTRQITALRYAPR
jgi:hypothetical protein